jgi:hypothetical protein
MWWKIAVKKEIRYRDNLPSVCWPHRIHKPILRVRDEASQLTSNKWLLSRMLYLLPACWCTGLHGVTSQKIVLCIYSICLEWLRKTTKTIFRKMLLCSQRFRSNLSYKEAVLDVTVWVEMFYDILAFPLDSPCGVVVRVSGHRSRDPGFDSRLHRIFGEVAGLERGPLSLVRITEELLGWKSSGSGSRKTKLMAVGNRCAEHVTPSIRKSWY